MGFRFRKRINLGIANLNVSKRGVGLSTGVPGARFSFGKGKPRVTVGVPGTGLSLSQQAGGKRRRRSPNSTSADMRELGKAEALADAEQNATEKHLEVLRLQLEGLEAQRASMSPIDLARLDKVKAEFELKRLEIAQWRDDLETTRRAHNDELFKRRVRRLLFWGALIALIWYAVTHA